QSYGQAMSVGLRGSGATADDPRAACAQVDRALDPALGVRRFVMKAAHARLAGREQHPRGDAVLGEGWAKTLQIGQSEIHRGDLEQDYARARFSQGRNQVFR